jgi:plasmid stabilization system protein ParE
VNLLYSQAALADLRRIDAWLSAIEADLAADAQAAIRQRIRDLLANPAIGSPLRGGRRKLAERRFNYLILYRRDGDAVTILRIRYAREDWR